MYDADALLDELEEEVSSHPDEEVDLDEDSDDELDIVLLPVAGFLRYCMGVDDQGETYDLEGDPIRERLIAAGRKAVFGDPASVSAFRELIGEKDVMGRNLFQYGNTGKRLLETTARMLNGPGAVRKTMKDFFHR